MKVSMPNHQDEKMEEELPASDCSMCSSPDMSWVRDMHSDDEYEKVPNLGNGDLPTASNFSVPTRHNDNPNNAEPRSDCSKSSELSMMDYQGPATASGYDSELGHFAHFIDHHEPRSDISQSSELSTLDYQEGGASGYKDQLEHFNHFFDHVNGLALRPREKAQIGGFNGEFETRKCNHDAQVPEEQQQAVHPNLSEAPVPREMNEQDLELAKGGVSPLLYDALQAFRESLMPEPGNSHSGWTITYCDAKDGKNINVHYDEELYNLLSDTNENSYTRLHNFRCEVSPELSPEKNSVIDSQGPKQARKIKVFPLELPTPTTGSEKTWGDQFVSDFFQPFYSPR